MPYREIEDEGGVWMVFSTEPRSGANVRPQYATGWLSFQRGQERRRLSPIPADWEHADDAQVRMWLRSADAVGKTDDDWMTGASIEPGGSRRADSAPSASPGAEAAVDAPPALDTPAPPVEIALPVEAVETAPAVRPPAASASRVSQSIARIRAMLNDIRHDH